MKYTQDAKGILDEQKGTQLFEETLLVQETMLMRRAKTNVANLFKAHRELGEISTCCGVLPFPDKRKMQRELSQAQQELEGVKSLMRRAKADGVLAFQDLRNEAGNIFKRDFIENGGEVVHSYSSGQAKLFWDALKNPVSLDDKPENSASVESQTKRSNAGFGAVSGETAHSFVPLPGSQDVLSPFIANSMTEDDSPANHARIVSSTLGKVLEEDEHEARWSKTPEQSRDVVRFQLRQHCLRHHVV